jgi:HSP20 family protein
MSLINSLNPTRSRTESAAADRTPGPEPTLRPHFEIKETPEAYGATVHLPGVDRDGLDLTVEEGQLRVIGRRAWKQPAGWTVLYRESAGVPFELVLTHDNVLDADKIAAELRDGVLRVSLPKHEALKPRKIAVN